MRRSGKSKRECTFSQAAKAPEQALQDIKVLELSSPPGLPAIFCTAILGDLGAQVVKVEAPSEVDPITDAEEAQREAAFDSLNRNKRSVVLNLKSDDGVQIFHRLAESADVIVEGFRPGVAKRLGVDFTTVNKLNPKVIYCSITGYGQDGPYRDLPGFDLNYASTGGAVGLTGEYNGPPVIPMPQFADLAGGSLSAVIGILAALLAREKTGRGQYIDLSMTDGLVWLLSGISRKYFATGKTWKRGESIVSGVYPYYHVYQAGDGRFLSVACREPLRFWENLCRALGKEELIRYHFVPAHRLTRPKGEEWARVFSSLREVFLTKTRDEWFEQLRHKDIPVSKVHDLDEVFSDPQVVHRGMVAVIDNPSFGKIRQVGNPLKLSETPVQIRTLAPLAGEHTDEIIQALGYAKGDIERLKREGVIKQATLAADGLTKSIKPGNDKIRIKK